MSNYHVKRIRKDGRVANVVFHIDIPLGNNSVTGPPTITWRDAVSEYRTPRNLDGTWGTISSELQNIDAGELTELQSGAKVEVSHSVMFAAEDSDAQKKTKIDTMYNGLKISILKEIQEEFKFWGMEITV